MKKLLAFLGAIIVELSIVPSFLYASAQDVCPKGYENLCKIDIATNPNIFGNVVNILIIIAIILSVCFLIWGGIRWITSGGDKGKVEHAKATIVGAIIGLVISFLAYFIVSVVVYVLTGSPMSLPIPKLV